MYRAIEYDNDFLAHYGVKGMKWGVRKARKTVTSATRGAANKTKKGAHIVVSSAKARRDASHKESFRYMADVGAGEFRKKTNARIRKRSVDPTYKKEYDKALARLRNPNYVADKKRLMGIGVNAVAAGVLLGPEMAAISTSYQVAKYRNNKARARRTKGYKEYKWFR